MFQKLWQLIAVPFGYLMRWCYQFASDVLHLDTPGVAWAYIFALFLFTLITKILLFPLSLKQQRSTAMMSAYKPMIDEIQKKYANDKQKQQEEMQKLQQEYGYNPLSGCLPMLIQFPIIFGLIEVIYQPLTYMLRLDTEVLTALKNFVAPLVGMDATANNRLLETKVIEFVQNTANRGALAELALKGTDYTAAEFNGVVSTITDFQMNIGPVQLFSNPSAIFPFLKNAYDPNISWLIIFVPLFSIATMVLSQLITMRLSGQKKSQGNQMMITTLMMSLLFGVFSFTYAAGFSLYWGLQNIILIGQAFILRKICDPEKLAAEAQAKIDAQRKSVKKATKKVVEVVDTNTGVKIEKELSLSEIEKLRLQRAREIDAERYGN